MINKMEIGEVKKIKNGEWLVQFPKGRMVFKTKKVAEKWSELLKRGVVNE